MEKMKGDQKYEGRRERVRLVVERRKEEGCMKREGEKYKELKTNK